MNVGDFVKGLPGSPYSITNESMTRGVITGIAEGKISVKILDHASDRHGKFDVNPKYFEVIGHVKPFNREDVLNLLKSGCKKSLLEYDLSDANLSDAKLSGADLRGANLDFSCWPLWCGGLKVKVDKRLACQLAYHLCTMQCDDADYIQMRNSILDFANQFHRVQECGIQEPINLPEKE